jgi:uncharacterized membrane protein
MEPALGMAALWILFGGTHIGLATAPIRGPLVRRTGETGYLLIFSLIAAASFTLLVSYYAEHRFEGAPGLALGRFEPLRWALIGIIAFGAVLVAAGTVSYTRSPYAIFSSATRGPRGTERITRHPFFCGVALFALAHVFVAPRLIGAVFAAGLACLAILGARHQDAKFLARRGPAYADYLAVTSTIPFAAIAAGRQRLVWSELPIGAIAVGIVAAIALRAAHDSLFALGGAPLAGTVLGAAGWATLSAWRAARRDRASGGRRLGKWERLPARLLYATAVGHVVVGVALFREPLAAIWRDGIVNSIGSQVVPGAASWIAALRPQFEREAAFWFVLFGPLLWLLGRIVDRAIEQADGCLLRTIAWYLLGFGIVGAAVMPVSGFWLLIAYAPLLLVTASRLAERARRENASLAGNGELRWHTAQQR